MRSDKNKAMHYGRVFNSQFHVTAFNLCLIRYRGSTLTLNLWLLTELACICFFKTFFIMKEQAIKLKCSHDTAMTQLTSQTTYTPFILQQSHTNASI